MLRDLPTAAGPADYVLFIDRQTIGVIEAKKVVTPLTGVSLEDTDNLPAPGLIAAEIVEDLEAALVEFSELADALNGIGVEVTGADQA